MDGGLSIVAVVVFSGLFFVSGNGLTEDMVETSPKVSTLSSLSVEQIQQLCGNFHMRRSEDVVQPSMLGGEVVEQYAIGIRDGLLSHSISMFTLEHITEVTVKSFLSNLGLEGMDHLVSLIMFVTGSCFIINQLHSACSSVWKLVCLMFGLLRWCYKFCFSKQKQQPSQSATTSSEATEVDKKKHVFTELVSNPQAPNVHEKVDIRLCYHNTLPVSRACAWQTSDSSSDKWTKPNKLKGECLSDAETDHARGQSSGTTVH